ncbi:hypothetical protein ZWY2020_030049 [Hordeum vulgare]|nr:hypothetical protein ZWY2020_030049 [Hordeum vulgare]
MFVTASTSFGDPSVRGDGGRVVHISNRGGGWRAGCCEDGKGSQGSIDDEHLGHNDERGDIDVDDYDTQDCGAEDVNINGNKDAVGAKDNHIEDINPMENGKSAEEYVCGSLDDWLQNPVPFGVELETTNYASQLRRHRPPAPLQRRQPPPPTAARRLPQLDHLLPELTRNSTSLRATPSSSYAGWEVVDRRNRPCLLPLRPPFPTRGRRRPSSHVFPEPFKRIRVIFRSSRPPSPSQSLAISPSRRGSPLAAA